PTSPAVRRAPPPSPRTPRAAATQAAPTPIPRPARRTTECKTAPGSLRGPLCYALLRPTALAGDLRPVRLRYSYCRTGEDRDPRPFRRRYYSTILATTPAPTVRPPSRMAKRSFSSI